MRSPSPLSIVLLALAASGCGKTMTEADCERVGKHMRAVWEAEVQASAPSRDAGAAAGGSDRAKLIIKGEGDRVATEWTSLCRREIQGRRVDDREVECILAAKSIADVQACATTQP